MLLWVIPIASQNPPPAATGGPVANSRSADQEFSDATKIYFEKGSKEALPKLQHALESFRAAGDRAGEAKALGFIGNCFKHMGDYKSALDYLARALGVAREIHDRLQEGKTLNHLGLLAWEMADYPKAVSQFDQSIAVAHEVGNRQLEASALNNLGLVYDEQGDYEHSLPRYQQALAIDREIGFERGEAEAIANLGGVYLNLGRFRDAAAQYGQSLALAERLNLKPLASQASGNLALCQAAIGDSKDAISSFDRAIRLAREAGLAKEESDWHKGKGSAYVSQGKFDLARVEYNQAIAEYEKSQLKREWVEALSDRGELYLDLGDGEQAENDFAHAAEIARSIGYTRGFTDNLARFGRLEARRGRVAQAERLYRESLERARTAGQVDAQAGVLLLLSEVMRDSGKPDDAVRASREALDLAHSSGALLTEAQAKYSLAEAMFRSGRPREALQDFDECAPIAHDSEATDLEWRIAYGRGRALEALGRNDDAVDAYIHAISVIESVRAEIAEERFRTGYFQDKSRVYVDLVRLLIKLGRFKQAFQFSEKLRTQGYRRLTSQATSRDQDPREVELRSRIRQLQRRVGAPDKSSENSRGRADEQAAQQLRAAEREYQALLDDLHAHDPAEGSAASLASPDQLQRHIPPGSAILEYVVGEGYVSAMVVSPDRIWATTVPAANLAPRIELLRKLIARHQGTDWEAPSAALYELLIAPVYRSGQLQGIRRLYIVPNGVLHYLPFATLARKTQRRSRTLVQDYEIAYLPSASVIDRKKPEPAQGNLLAIAPRMPDLAYTQAEVRNISRYFHEPRAVLSGDSATRAAFEQRASGYRIIHLATHGYFNKFNPLFSGIELQAANGDNGRLEVHDILGLRLRSELVTLSACETGLSSGFFDEVPAGDEFVGLTRAFLSAGSTAVMASLWSVNDSSTATFMQKFYQSQGGSDRVAAITQAQRAMISGGNHYQHPFYWAPFVLTETGQQGAENLPRKNAEAIRVSSAVGE